MSNKDTTAAEGNEAATLPAGYALFQVGRKKEAGEIFARVLQRNPDQVQALFFLGVIRAEEGELDAAEALFVRCGTADSEGSLVPLILHHRGRLCQRRGDDEAAIGFFDACLARKPDFAPGFNDRGVSLYRLGQYLAACTSFDRAVAFDPSYAVAHDNRGLVLTGLGRGAAARAAFQTALALAPEASAIWTHLGLACLKAEDFAAAVTAFQRALALNAEDDEARAHLVEALARAHRLDEAAREADQWAERRGVVVKPCRGTEEARILLLGGSRLCNTPTQFLFGGDRFTTISLYLLPPDLAVPIDVHRLPDCDLVFNAISDPDHGAPFLDPAAALCRELGRPVLNPPQDIPKTRRDQLGAPLADIQGLVVPVTRRVGRPELMALAGEDSDFTVPLLLRPVGAHGGSDLRRVMGPADVANYLGAVPFDEFYVTDYHDYRSADGRYRKYRFIFVDREVYPYHLAIASDWLVHYWRADMTTEGARAEEAAFLADYSSVFGGGLATTVEAVARRLDLDYAGMDCAVTRDGQVLLFEANANMLVHLEEPHDLFPYKHVHLPKIFDAVSRLVTRKRAR